MNFTIGIKKYFVIFFLSAFLFCGANLFGQETLGELTTSMGIEEQMRGQGQPNRNPAAPKTTQEANSPPMNQQPSPAAVPAEQNAVSPPAAEQPKESNNIDIKDFNEFQRELNRINVTTRGEEQQWLSLQDNRVELARSIEELVISQLRFVRKLAESENSEQTIKAIDLVIKQRQERMNKLITKLEDTSRLERQQKANEQRMQRRSTTGTTTEGPAPRTQRRPSNAPGMQQ